MYDKNNKMILPVHIIGAPVLRKQAEEIDNNYENLDKLIENMFETMYEADGIGIAAPQIGRSVRLIVIDATPLAEEDPTFTDFKKVLINPKIIERSEDTIKSNEGCLSVPGIREDVERSQKIRIEYFDENFEKHDETYEEMAAVILQHEYDHLDGKLFTDNISPLRKKLIKIRLLNISKGKFSAAYKCKLRS